MKENNITITHPELLTEWDYEKNNELGLYPEDFTKGMNKKVWWKCEKNHKYEAIIHNRISGKKCPICANQKILEGYNDLVTTNPKLSAEWHPTKNGNLKPIQVTAGSDKKAWWKCSYGHEWQAKVYHRTEGRGCPICSGRQVLLGFNDLQTINSELAKEWHPTKNGELKPTMVTLKLGKKVWWKCSSGHEWQETVVNRKNGINCPFCSGNKILTNFNDLKFKNPELAKEWHPTKNGELKPTQVFPNSRLNVWWLDKYGHEWEAQVTSRNNGNGCPVCSGRQVLLGFNDLATKNPKLATEWHPTKNGNLKSIQVTAGSDKKVWWKCTEGHEWSATIVSRNNGNSCPICSGRQILLGYNDLNTLNPELAREWHPIKNGNLKPTQTTIGSKKKVWWIGKCGHEWESVIHIRNKGHGCPICSGLKVLEGYNDLTTKNPELASEWNYHKNGDLKPTEVTANTNKKIWWYGKCGHEWQANIGSRNQGIGCPICYGRQVLKGFNDFTTINPELAKEWHPAKNGNLKPTQVTSNSHKRVWWICSEGHEWKSMIKSRNKGANCPICNESKGEKIISELLNKYNVTYIPQYKIKECKNKNSLPFDFAIIDKHNNIKLLIEYDGIQHYKSVSYFGGKKALKNNKLRDKIKTDYCIKNNISFIRIPYWEIDNIDKIVLKKLWRENLI